MTLSTIDRERRRPRRACAGSSLSHAKRDRARAIGAERRAPGRDPDDPRAAAARRRSSGAAQVPRADLLRRRAAGATCSAASPGASARARAPCTPRGRPRARRLSGSAIARSEQGLRGPPGPPRRRRRGSLCARATAPRRLPRSARPPGRCPARREPRTRRSIPASPSPRFNEGVHGEGRQVPLVEADRIAQRDRPRLVGLRPHAVEERRGALPIAAVPGGEGRPVEPGGRGDGKGHGPKIMLDSGHEGDSGPGPLPLATAVALRFAPDIPERLKQLPATPIDYDRSLLDDREKQALAELIEVSRPMGEIFLRQVSEKNPALRRRLTSEAARTDAGSRGRARLLPHQRGSVGPPRRQRAVHRRAAEAARRRLLPRRT